MRTRWSLRPEKHHNFTLRPENAEHTVEIGIAVWGVMSGDRPGPVGDLEDPFGVL
jgi:hypothetical protein